MLKTIVEKFNISGSFVDAVPLGQGHINSTYMVTLSENGTENYYVLQKINHTIFKDVDGLMNNIALVTAHLNAKMQNTSQKSLVFIKTKTNERYYFENDGDYYRMYHYVGNSKTYQKAESLDVFYKTAVAFGQFVNLLSDFDATRLTETIPDFHNTVKRFADFKQAVKDDKMNRLEGVKAEVDFILSREEDCGIVVNLLNEGRIPLRVTHNDTKLNNVLFNNETGQILSVIDLDTVMPGLALNDYGDAIRFGASSGAEDETDLSKIYMSLDLFETYTKGYLSEAKSSLTKTEKNHLAISAKLMTLECGMRFLGDHLNGDVYFKIHRENHNLDRARTQLKLVADMESKMEQMKEIVERYS